jgi:hypothetical protein
MNTDNNNRVNANTLNNDIVNRDILKYFSNPSYQTNKDNEVPEINAEDKKFYRKRVLAMGKEIYSGSKYDDNINKAYDSFISLAINHCKIIDLRDILQADYPINTESPNSQISSNFDISHTNTSVMRQNKPTNKTLDGFVKITTKTENKFIPTQRNVNLKQNKLKTKGIKKKKKDKICD